MSKVHPLLSDKHTGILLPLFSMSSKEDWGIGDISSFSKWIEFLSGYGIDIVEILPINEMPPGVNCPYTSLSGFAVDPVYAAIGDIEELNENPKIKNKLLKENFTKIKQLKKEKHILYDDIRKLKYFFLWQAYLLFQKNHREKNLRKTADFENFKKANGYWLNDYALFRTLKDEYNWISWTHWPDQFKNRNAQVLEDFAGKNADRINFFKYIQWTIEKQWCETKRKAEKLQMKIYGDLPFAVNQESGDVWSRQNEFDISASLGAPPDAYSATGQDWGLPVYNWREIEKGNFQWWRQRIRKSADFYHIYRLDHMVGFFRTWIVPHDKTQKPRFDIENENEQIARGKRFLKTAISASDMLPVAEDLGLIPLYVGKILKEMNIPGYKVARWEKKKNEKGERTKNYKSPSDYDKISLAATSTHDTETLKEWWNNENREEKNLFWEMANPIEEQALTDLNSGIALSPEKNTPCSRRKSATFSDGAKGKNKKAPPFSKAHPELIKNLLKARSALAVLPVQDILGEDERINTPNTTGVRNWSYKMKSDIETVSKNAMIIGQMRLLKNLISEVER